MSMNKLLDFSTLDFHILDISKVLIFIGLAIKDFNYVNLIQFFSSFYSEAKGFIVKDGSNKELVVFLPYFQKQPSEVFFKKR